MQIKVGILIVAFSVLSAVAEDTRPARAVPTNSLAFHLQSLGRTPTKEEREIVEAALALMQRHHLRTDYPLRSILHDERGKEWVLVFDSRAPDAGFTVFMRSKDSEGFEMKSPLVQGRIRFPPEQRER